MKRFQWNGSKIKGKIESNSENEEFNIAKLSRGIVKFMSSSKKPIKNQEKSGFELKKLRISWKSMRIIETFIFINEILYSDMEILNEDERKQGYFVTKGEKAQKKSEKNFEKQYLYIFFMNNSEKSQHYSHLSILRRIVRGDEFGKESSLMSENYINGKKIN